MTQTEALDYWVNALKSLNDQSSQIVEAFLSSLRDRLEPKIIYHYTDDVGLRGILESGQLWLSDIFSLNDPSELSHGLSQAVNLLNKKVENSPPEKRVFAEHFSNFLTFGLKNTAHYFVCSFSYDNDDLGQWRAYADNGRGFALGFDAHSLVNIFQQVSRIAGAEASTFPVTYDDKQLVNIHSQLIEAVYPLISLPQNKSHNSSLSSEWRELLTSLSIHALHSAAYFKHKAYLNESEFRLLQVFPANSKIPGVAWRSRPYELAKYQQLPWKGSKLGVLKEIMIGPAADKLKATQFVKDCLDAFHTEEISIIPSEIPYRTLPR
jgi:hypothetical protein